MSLDEAKELELQARCCASTAAELASSSVCNQATPTIAKVQSSKARACARSFRKPRGATRTEISYAQKSRKSVRNHGNLAGNQKSGP